MKMVLTLIGSIVVVLGLMVTSLSSKINENKADATAAVTEERRQREDGDAAVDDKLQIELGDLEELVNTRFKDANDASTFRHNSQDKHFDLIYPRIVELENGEDN